MNLTCLVESTTLHEGDVSGLYLCPRGKLSIARGRNLEANPLSAREWRWLYENKCITVHINQRGREYLQANDIDRTLTELRSRLLCFERLNDVRQNVLIEMSFQMGVDGVLGFHDMIDAITAQDWATAAIEGLDSKWAREDAPQRASELMAMLRTGEFT
jgi:lysozyme